MKKLFPLFMVLIIAGFTFTAAFADTLTGKANGTPALASAKNFSSNTDIKAPTVKEIKVEANNKLVVYFSEALSKASAENIANYRIDGLAILNLQPVDGRSDKIRIITEPQKPGRRYELIIKNIEDRAKTPNKLTEPIKAKFIGVKADTTPPKLSDKDASITSKNNIQLVFTDESALDETKMLEPENYKITDSHKESIAVQKVQKISSSKGSYKVQLTVDDLKPNTSYLVEVTGIADEYGNIIENAESLRMRMNTALAAPATIKSVSIKDLMKLQLNFSKALDQESAENINNYEISNGIGTPLTAQCKNSTVTLEVNTLSPGKSYRLKLSGVKDTVGNELKISHNFRTEPEHPEVCSITQLNDHKFEITMSDDVVDITSNRKFQTGGVTFTVKIAQDDKRVVILNAEGTIYEGKEYSFDISKVLADRKGVKAKNANGSKTTIIAVYGEPLDTEKPYIVEVKAINNSLIEVEYSEKMSTSGAYTIEYEDEGTTKKLAIDKCEVKKNVVRLSLNSKNPMKSEYEYILKIKTAAKDLAGNSSENGSGDCFEIETK